MAIVAVFQSQNSFQNQSPITYSNKVFGKELITIIIGYARVSTVDQNLDRQLDSLNDNGAERIFTEKITGKKSDRPELLRMMEQLRDGDTVIVSELTRLSRSTKDLFSIVEQMQARGANIRSLKETWLDTTTPHGKLMFTIFAGLSQFEADLTAQRTREGLAAARARGRLGGRPKTDETKIKQALKLYTSKEYTVKEIEDLTGVKKSILYRHINAGDK